MSWIPSYKKPQSAPEPPTIVQWSTGTDEEIIAMVNAHYQGIIDLHDYWAVGDERTVSLSAMESEYSQQAQAAQNMTFVLSQVGGKLLSDGTTECAFQVDQKDCLNPSGRINSTNINVWKNSDIRTWCNSTYKNAFPSTLKPIFKDFLNLTGVGGSMYWSGLDTTTDTFALRAEIEIFGNITYSVSGEGSQIKWYETSANRKKKLSKYAIWYERSPYIEYDNATCCVTADGVASYRNPSYYAGIAPFGVI